VRLQRKPNRWSCSVAAFAMAIGIPVQQLIDEIGHNGGEIAFPKLAEPMQRRGFHPQELIHAAWQHGFACTPVEVAPVIRASRGADRVRVWFEDNWARFTWFIENTFGVLEGRGLRCHHAVHYRYGDIFDPDGETYQYSRERCEADKFYGNRLWVFTRNDIK